MAPDVDERQLKTGVALLAPLGKELVVARGADRVRFLHGVVTGNVAGTAVGGGVHALLLTPKAHVLSEMRIFVREMELYVVVAAGQGAETAAALSRYAVMDDFTAEVAPDFQMIAVLGPDAAGRLDALGLPAGALAEKNLWSHVDAGEAWLVRVEQLGETGFWVGGSATEIARVGAALRRSGMATFSPEIAEVARITAGEPAWGQEITDEFFPMEIGLGDAIDYKKGCFLGQEPIVRIRDRGHTNWRLARLTLPEGARPAAGDRLESDLKPKAGKLTSVAIDLDGRAVALGVVHVGVPAGDPVRVVGASGVVTATVHETSS